MKIECSIVIATYNEVENVANLLKQLDNVLSKCTKKFEIIIVDDNSPDNTFEELLRLADIYKRLRPVLRTSNHGLAKSILEGLRLAKFENVVIMDSDLSHQPSEIPEMLLSLENGKLMVWRSRYIPGGDIQNSSTNKTQYNLSRIFNILIKRILDLPILDTTNGFFCFQKRTIKLS